MDGAVRISDGRNGSLVSRAACLGNGWCEEILMADWGGMLWILPSVLYLFWRGGSRR